MCICILRVYDRPHPRCSETTLGCHTRQHSPKRSTELLTMMLTSSDYRESLTWPSSYNQHAGKPWFEPRHPINISWLGKQSRMRVVSAPTSNQMCFMFLMCFYWFWVRRGKEEREKHQTVWNPQVGLVPWPRIELATFHCTGWPSTKPHWQEQTKCCFKFRFQMLNI